MKICSKIATKEDQEGEVASTTMIKVTTLDPMDGSRQLEKDKTIGLSIKDMMN